MRQPFALTGTLFFIVRGATFHLSLPAIADGSQLFGCQIAPSYRFASPWKS
jgi:hypothetical protein